MTEKLKRMGRPPEHHDNALLPAITFRRETLQKLTERAKKNGETRAGLVKRLVVEYLEKSETR